ncbi:hypothetical protein Emag_002649 [Eimeria magna]
MLYPLIGSLFICLAIFCQATSLKDTALAPTCPSRDLSVWRSLTRARWGEEQHAARLAIGQQHHPHKLQYQQQQHNSSNTNRNSHRVYKFDVRHMKTDASLAVGGAAVCAAADAAGALPAALYFAAAHAVVAATLRTALAVVTSIFNAVPPLCLPHFVAVTFKPSLYGQLWPLRLIRFPAARWGNSWISVCFGGKQVAAAPANGRPCGSFEGVDGRSRGNRQDSKASAVAVQMALDRLRPLPSDSALGFV